jgi:hypothetical protein
MRRSEPRLYGASWFRDLDSNQDTQLQRLMSYQLDDPGKDYKIVAEGRKSAQAAQHQAHSSSVVWGKFGAIRRNPLSVLRN